MSEVSSKRAVVFHYLPFFIWLAVIFCFSSIPGSGEYYFTWKYFVSRKAAHILEYAVLAFLLVRIVNLYFSGKKQLWILVILFGLVFSLLDELHQVFVFGRQGKLSDVFFDGAGIILGLLVYFHFSFPKRKPLDK